MRKNQESSVAGLEEVRTVSGDEVRDRTGQQHTPWDLHGMSTLVFSLNKLKGCVS